MKKEVWVEPDSTEFWRALYGLAPVSSQEINIYFKNEQENCTEKRSLDIITKGFLEEVQESAPDDAQNYEDLFGKSIDELLTEDQILFGYEYDDPSDPDLFQVDFDAPESILGMKPRWITVFSPAGTLTNIAIKKAIVQYCQSFGQFNVSKFYFVKKRSVLDVKAEIRSEIDEVTRPDVFAGLLAAYDSDNTNGYNPNFSDF